MARVPFTIDRAMLERDFDLDKATLERELNSVAESFASQIESIAKRIGEPKTQFELLQDKLSVYCREFEALMGRSKRKDDLADLLEGNMTGRYTAHDTKRIALSLLRAELGRIEVVTKKVRVVAFNLQKEIIQRRKEESQSPLAPTVEEARFNARLKHDLQECNMLMSMAKSAMETLETLVLYWSHYNPSVAPPSKPAATKKQKKEKKTI